MTIKKSKTKKHPARVRAEEETAPRERTRTRSRQRFGQVGMDVRLHAGQSESTMVELRVGARFETGILAVLQEGLPMILAAVAAGSPRGAIMSDAFNFGRDAAKAEASAPAPSASVDAEGSLT